MKVSWSWLSQYVSLSLAPEALADALTMVGLEVDSVADRWAFLERVPVGRILSVSAHPNADRLRCCRVEAGDRGYDVVCGAPNAAEGMLAPLALPGAVLPDGRELAAGTIRGAASEGMLCSAAELGLGTDASGLMALDTAFVPGTPLNQALGLADPVFEIELTPNRPDCLSIIGVAREAAAICGAPLVLPPESVLPDGDAIAAEAGVTVEAPDHCPRYAARLIREVTVAPSPDWLQDRLRSVGLKPINNVVDVTNFVMMELGQPLHAFDFQRLAGGRIVVRTAAEGEAFTTLDGKARRLTADTLMICDAERPVAVAGVMGGLNSEIETDTTAVLLESACFDPVSVRKTAKRLALPTDASHRFERGVDPHGTVRAMDRAAALIAEIAGGRVVAGRIDVHPRPAPVRVIDLDAAAVNRRLGTDLDAATMQGHLTEIGFGVAGEANGRLTVEVPSFRVDVARAEDLTEEVARRHGYNHIATTYPLIPAEGRPPSAPFALRRRIKHLMAGFGFHEAISYSFVPAASADRLRLPADDERRRAVEIRNPISEDLAVLRTSLLPGLLDAAARNISRQNRDLRLFEVGPVFIADDAPDTLPRETPFLAVLWTGRRHAGHWSEPSDRRDAPCDFFDLKGVAEGLMQRLGVTGASFHRLDAERCAYTRPGHSAVMQVGDRPLGRMGEVHPAVREAYGLKQAVFVMEIELPRLAEQIPAVRASRPLPRFPAIARDLTLIVDRNLPAAAVTERVAAMNEPLVEQVALFDAYAGDPIPAGRRSLSFRITYRSDTGTLADEQINPLHAAITRRLLAELNADLPA